MAATADMFLCLLLESRDVARRAEHDANITQTVQTTTFNSRSAHKTGNKSVPKIIINDTI